MAIPEILERASVQVGIASLTDYASVEQFALGGFDKLSDMLKVVRQISLVLSLYWFTHTDIYIIFRISNQLDQFDVIYL